MLEEVLADVVLLEVRIPVSLPPVIICDIVVLSTEKPSIVAFDVVFDEVMLLSDVSVGCESGVSYIMAAIRPLAENVDPAAVEVSLSVPVVFVVPAVEVVLLVVLGVVDP
jgi:hypothetical protein